MEKDKILKLSFKELWNDIWYSENNSKEYDKSNIKYELIKNNLKMYVDNSSKKYIYNEWEIPKGRRNINETDKECAKREFKEETNIREDSYHLYENILPFNETYRGSNNIQYKNVYYLASVKNNIKLEINNENNEQIHEVKSIKWISKDMCKEYIRDYSDYKLNLLNEIFTFLYSDHSDKII